jgi:peptide/nickel transport system substrate-binding protein
VHDEAIYIPVHHQMLAYATKNNVDIPVDPENQVKLKYVAFKAM